jgi:hypothetical protein
MKNKQTIVDSIETILSEVENLQDRLEIICQVVIRLGVSGITRSSLPDTITPENVVSVVLNDIKANGETIWNSLARQGLLMLSWLEKSEEIRKE